MPSFELHFNDKGEVLVDNIKGQINLNSCQEITAKYEYVLGSVEKKILLYPVEYEISIEVSEKLND